MVATAPDPPPSPLDTEMRRIRKLLEQGRFAEALPGATTLLEQEPTLAHIDAQKNLILAADEKGKTVQQNLERILTEMNRMTALLRGPDGAAGH